MKHISPILLLFFGVVVGCGVPGNNGNNGNNKSISGSGTSKTQTYSETGFVKLSASGIYEVEVTQGANLSVSVTTDDNVVPYLLVTKEGPTLTLGLKPNVSIENTTIKAKVTMPSIEGIELSGASSLKGTGFKDQPSLSLSLNGTSKISLEKSNAQKVELKGSGASKFNILAFPIKEANVELSGASEADIQVSDKLDYNLTGSSSLNYKGEPTIGNKIASGTAKATKL